MPNDERILETMPTGTLGLVATDSCIGLAQKVDAYLQGWREHREHQHANESAFKDYYKNSYIIKPSTPRFGSGEAKCVINQSVRGYDLYIMVDVTNLQSYLYMLIKRYRCSHGPDELRLKACYRCSRRKSKKNHSYHAFPL